jgi:N-acetylmuramoyl-L-alanine amidase/Secretion system C-terminal sorting domain
MKNLFTLLFIVITALSFAQQKKGKSNYTTIDFTTVNKNNFLKSEESLIAIQSEGDVSRFFFRKEIILKPAAIGHEDAVSFIAFSCRWQEQKVMPNNTKIWIRFSQDKTTWQEWKPIEIDGHNIDGSNKNYSTLSYIDVANKYYQIKINTNLDGQDSEIKSLFLNFFNPDKVVGTIENSTTLNRPTGTESCPCPLPTFTTRSQWNCPQGQGMAPGVITTPAVTHLIVHHSDGPNTSTNWSAVILSIWNYHTGTNGWSDIGYNWLVTPDGTLFEGRGSNSSTANVQGAHFCGFNQATMGTCMVGTYTSVDVTAAARTKLTAILGWKACQAGIPAEGTILHASSGAVLNRISGHRDGCATDCPGTFFYGTLPQLRSAVTAYIDACGNVIPCNASLNIAASGCPNNTITFTPTNIVNGGTAPTYAWYVNNVFAQNGATYILNNATNGTKVYARMTSNATCNPAQINSDTITLSCVTPPVCNASLNIAASGCPNNTITFTPTNVVNGGTAPTYAWYVNNVFAQNGATYILNNATNGAKVFAKMTSNPTCNPAQINSDTITLSCVTPPVLLSTDSTEFLYVAPNPSNGNFYIKFRRNQNTEMQYCIIDMLGRKVYTSTKEMAVGTKIKQFYLTRLPSGIYSLVIYFNGIKTVKRILIRK